MLKVSLIILTQVLVAILYYNQAKNAETYYLVYENERADLHALQSKGSELCGKYDCIIPRETEKDGHVCANLYHQAKLAEKKAERAWDEYKPFIKYYPIFELTTLLGMLINIMMTGVFVSLILTCQP